MSVKNILLVGGGGHCKSCIEAIESIGDYTIAGIIDTKDKIGKKVLGYPIIGSDEDLEQLKEDFQYALITLGQIKSSSLRVKLFNKIKGYGFILPNIISSSAFVSDRIKIGEGNVILSRVSVNADVVIGSNNILNTACNIEHDCSIGNNNHVSTGVLLNGNVKIENDCFIGSGTVVNQGVGISSGTVIGSSSLVRKNISLSAVYSGNPLTTLNK